MRELEAGKVLTVLVVLVLVVRLHRTVCEFLVEVGDICVRSQNRHKRGLDRPRGQGTPVHLLEPGVVADLLRTAGSNPVFGILLQQPHEDVL